jgi:ribulose-5-phosphate 4-epimerase/fuculose-1-phosphate aldolase
MKSEWALREDVVEVGRRLYLAGYIRGADGNLSVKISHGEVLITPSRSAKGFLESCSCGHAGESNRGKPAAILGDIFSLGDLPGEERCRGGCPCPPSKDDCIYGRQADYSRWGAAGDHDPLPARNPGYPLRDTVILSHHGIIGVGGDIFEAWATIEHVEACVEVLSIASTLGEITPLPPDKLHELDGIRSLVQQARDRNY